MWGSRVGQPRRIGYHRAGCAAHALDEHPTNVLTFVYWSSGGNWLAFYEFKRQLAYEVVFLNLPASEELLL